ncbi:hypothetical protein Scep_007498 [Stephania cephalantha]|uniref:Uncharacterized protein n=1 Tax=Stephania cephalantha TaxID=152367 RepID=A0AAP0KA36_9MAGN
MGFRSSPFRFHWFDSSSSSRNVSNLLLSFPSLFFYISSLSLLSPSLFLSHFREFPLDSLSLSDSRE